MLKSYFFDYFSHFVPSLRVFKEIFGIRCACFLTIFARLRSQEISHEAACVLTYIKSNMNIITFFYKTVFLLALYLSLKDYQPMARVVNKRVSTKYEYVDKF